MAQNPALFDRRTLSRYRKEGVVTDEQIKEHLKKLPDCTEKAETLGAEPLPAGGKDGKDKGR
ncbi:MAG: hypothetical protein HY907_04495 [Deltaproteobacteria bacterium]|nr:hypothetical protein [Deltaproteobacteria bacterium]